MKPEFDHFAKDYLKLSGHPIKRLLGMANSNLPFLQLKLIHLEMALKKMRSVPIRILDFGCGDGQFGTLLRSRFPDSCVIGVDCSIEMMSQSKVGRNFVHEGENRALPFPDKTFDLIVCVCVFHHIDARNFSIIFSELSRLLTSDGHIALFEHNPKNPVTRFVVNRTPVDKDAVLVSANSLERVAMKLGLKAVTMRGCGIVPPISRFMRTIDAQIGLLCPLAAQYMIVFGQD